MNTLVAEQDAVKVQSSQKPRKGELRGSNDALNVKQETNAGAAGKNKARQGRTGEQRRAQIDF